MNLEQQPLLSEEIACTKCGTSQKEGYKYCNICGAQNLVITRKKFARDREEENAYYKIWTYILVVLVLVIITFFLNDSFEFLIGTTIVFAIVDIVFIVQQPSIWSLVNFRGLDYKLLLLVFAAFIGSGIMVHFGISELNMILFGQSYSYTGYFQGVDYPIFWAILFIAIFPAIFEELAFRGFIFSNLKKVANVQAALWGSTFLFSIVHFSAISLIWLIPFAYCLGSLRKKYNTLVYGIVGHFTHNTTVILLEYFFE